MPTMGHENMASVNWPVRVSGAGVPGEVPTIPLTPSLRRTGERSNIEADLDRTAGEFLLSISAELVGALTIRLGDRWLAEELAHEAIARAWADWERVSAMDNPTGWVFRVGFNLASSHWRRRAAARRADQRRPIATASDASLSADAVALAAAIDRLSDQQQRIVILRYYLQFDVAETAAALGVSTGTVKTQTSRALRRLRLLVDDDR